MKSFSYFAHVEPSTTVASTTKDIDAHVDVQSPVHPRFGRILERLSRPIVIEENPITSSEEGSANKNPLSCQ